jgi:hypothetical protein
MNDVKLFNWKCSWHMLREQRLELHDNNILDLLDQMEKINSIGYLNIYSLLY